MHELLIESIGKKVTFTSKEIELLKPYFIPKKIRKRQYLLNAGDTCQYLTFVEKGMLRSFTVDDEGHEHVVQFAIEGWWIADMGSFLSGKEAIYNIEALEDSEVLNLSKQAMEEMMKQLPAMERYFRLLMQNNIVALQRRVVALKYELRQFVAQGTGGSIVNISSINAFKPTTGNPAYQAFKHGVEGLTKAAAFEYGTKGIRINSVAPGAIRTPMLATSLKSLGITEKDIIPTMSLVGRLGEPREVAQGSLFLSSDAASYVHGTVLHVGGGFELL